MKTSNLAKLILLLHCVLLPSYLSPSAFGNFLEGQGNDYFTNLEFKYLLPMGHGKDNIINEYVVRDGFLISGQSGGDIWDPFESGRTYFQVEPFYRRQTVETDFTSDAVNTNGMTFSVLYDNRDFQLNPSKGSSQEVAISRDWGSHSYFCLLGENLLERNKELESSLPE